MSKKHGSQGLVIILVTNSPVATVNAFLDQNGGRLPLAIGGGRNYGVRSIPHGYLLNHKNTVIWEGHPGGGSWDSIAIQALGQIPKGMDLDESKYPSRFRSILKKLKDKKFKSALSSLKGYVKSKNEKEKEAADSILSQVSEFAKNKLAEAKELEGAKNYLEALTLYKMLEKEFKGAFSEDLKEIGKEAYKERKRIESDKEIKKEIKAGELYSKAQKYEGQGKFAYLVSAYRLYQQIAKKYSGTGAATRAEERINYLKNSGELNYNANCSSCRRQGRTCDKHKRK